MVLLGKIMPSKKTSFSLLNLLHSSFLLCCPAFCWVCLLLFSYLFTDSFILPVYLFGMNVCIFVSQAKLDTYSIFMC